MRRHGDAQLPVDRRGLVSVKTEFPDITISKIRFLEAEGLIEPERTPSGYRKFYAEDVDRLKSILRMQRDEYLPLKVIKERLLKQGAGEVDEDGEADEARAGARRPPPRRSPRRRPASRCRSRRCRPPPGRAGADQGARVLRHRVLARARRRKYYDGDDYIVLSIVKDFFRFGVEPRHLTMYKHFEEREADFFETIVAPTLRQKNPDARRRPRRRSPSWR